MKPEKNTDAIRSRRASWTAWRSESDTTEIRNPRPSEANTISPMVSATRRMSPRNGALKTPIRTATSVDAISAESMATASIFPSRISIALTGATRKISTTPLNRSRTRLRAPRVTAMCCRISARTAGP